MASRFRAARPTRPLLHRDGRRPRVRAVAVVGLAAFGAGMWWGGLQIAQQAVELDGARAGTSEPAPAEPDPGAAPESPPAASPPPAGTTPADPPPNPPASSPPAAPATTSPPAGDRPAEHATPPPAPDPTTPDPADLRPPGSRPDPGTPDPADEPPEPELDLRALQERLAELGYWLDEPDGVDGTLTRQAVMAFQKVEGLARTGRPGPETLDALATATTPTPRAGGPATGIEIDLERQVLLVVVDGRVRHVLNTSTGREGWRTPPGEFTIEREVDGVRPAPLGDLYRPKYFHEGFTIHGAPEVPAQPASHGGARLTNAAMDMLWASGVAEIGTPVRVH